MILSTIPTITSSSGKVWENKPFNGAIATTLNLRDDLIFDNFDLSTYYALIINLTNKGKVIWYYSNIVDRDADFARLLIEIPEGGGTSAPRIKIHSKNPTQIQNIGATFVNHLTLTTPSLPLDDYNIWWSAQLVHSTIIGLVGIRFLVNGGIVDDSIGFMRGNFFPDPRSQVNQINLSGVNSLALDFNEASASGIATVLNTSILITN